MGRRLILSLRFVLFVTALFVICGQGFTASAADSANVSGSAATPRNLAPGLVRQDDSRSVKLVTQPWPPHVLDVNGQAKGPAVDKVRTILSQMGYSVEFTLLPWERAQYNVARGRADGFLLASHNEERDAYAIFTLPFVPQDWTWMYLCDSLVDTSSKAFHLYYRVSAFAGTNMLYYLKEHDYSVYEPPYEARRLINMLLEKRVDALLVNKGVAEWYLKQTDSEAKVCWRPERTMPLGIYFSRVFSEEHPEFVERFNTLLRKHDWALE